jgi:hypothetical protein
MSLEVKSLLVLAQRRGGGAGQEDQRKERSARQGRRAYGCKVFVRMSMVGRSPPSVARRAPEDEWLLGGA